MTRKEEIRQEAHRKYPYEGGTKGLICENSIPIFIQGAEWADKTMIEKACQWFNLHFRQVGTPKEIKHDFESKERMWKSFTQFIEE